MKKNNLLTLVALLSGLSLVSCGIAPADTSSNSDDPSSSNSTGSGDTPTPSDSTVTDPNEGSTIVSLFASTKEGTYFYNNGKANPSKEDFDVYALLDNGSSLELAPNEYEMEVPADFKSNGGTITFKVGEKSFDLAISLANYDITALSATLKSDKTFFKGQVNLNKDDLLVTAIFVDGVKKTLGNNDYDLITSSNFQYFGGEVTIQTTDKKASTKFNVEAKDVILDHIEVAKAPGKTHYAVNDKFDPSLMEIRATLNNGVSRILKEGEYEIENEDTPFTEIGSKTVKISYTYSYVPNGLSDGDKTSITKETSVTVTVSQTLDNLNLTSIDSFTQPVIYEGDSLKEKLEGNCKVFGTYSNGDVLEVENATITYPTGNATIGEYAEIHVEKDGISKDFSVKVSHKVECESSSKFAGASIQNGALRNFNLVKNNENYFELSYLAPFAMNGTISFNMAPVSLQKCGNGYFMAGMRLNTFMRLFINDTEVFIPNDSVLKQGEIQSGYEALYEQYQLVEVSDVSLREGANQIRVEIIPSTIGLKTCWGDNYYPSADFDYMLVSSAAEKLEDSDIDSLSIEGTKNPSIEDFTNKNIKVIANYKNGRKSVIAIDKLNFTLSSDIDNSFGLIGASIALKSDESKSLSLKVRKSLTLEAEEATFVGGSKQEAS